MLIPPPPQMLLDLTTKLDELTSGVSTLRQKLAGGTTSEVGAGGGLDEMLVEVGLSSDDDVIVAGSVLAATFVGEGKELKELIKSLPEADDVEETRLLIVLVAGTLSPVTVTATVLTVI
jgi:hypothetical protein